VLTLVTIALAGALGSVIARLEVPPAQESPEVTALREWVISHMTDSDRYIIGPEREFRFEWYTDMPGKRYSVPAMGSFAELQAYIDAHDINWLVVTPRQYARRQAVFEDWIVYHEPDKFMYARPIPGWEMVDYDRLGDSVDYLIYRRNPDAPQRPVYLRETSEHVFRLGQPPAYTADVNFGDVIALRGFDISTREIQPGQGIEITLHWQRLGRMNIGYTAFVHLLDEAESRVWGQQDQPPRAGAYPTDQWLLDEVVSERYRFTVPPDTPAGTYKVEVGWYDLATGRRLEVQPEPGVPAGDRYLLPVTVSVLEWRVSRRTLHPRPG